MVNNMHLDQDHVQLIMVALVALLGLGICGLVGNLMLYRIKQDTCQNCKDLGNFTQTTTTEVTFRGDGGRWSLLFGVMLGIFETHSNTVRKCNTCGYTMSNAGDIILPEEAHLSSHKS